MHLVIAVALTVPVAVAAAAAVAPPPLSCQTPLPILEYCDLAATDAPRRISGMLDARPGLDLGTAEQFVWENERECDESLFPVDHNYDDDDRFLTILSVNRRRKRSHFKRGRPDELVSSRIFSLTTCRILS
ncbi:hypothetical protein R3P38DRAFT_3362298 [Favolaschia claudopus]|uniref:Uncharacterized protein n=1 Tax=Favolaschia claudopus TaxID=2862362 RepID=A0AAW0AP61_9AGAR